MRDCSRLGNRPEAVAKHQQVGHEQKHGDPNQRRDGDGGAVGAGEHQTPSSELELELVARTGMASAALNSNPSGAPELGRSRLAVRMVRISPPSDSTRRSSVAPWKAWSRSLARKRTVAALSGEAAADAAVAGRMHSGRSENRAAPSGSEVGHCSAPQVAVPWRTSACNKFVCPMNCAV